MGVPVVHSVRAAGRLASGGVRHCYRHMQVSVGCEILRSKEPAIPLVYWLGYA